MVTISLSEVEQTFSLTTPIDTPLTRTLGPSPYSRAPSLRIKIWDRHGASHPSCGTFYFNRDLFFVVYRVFYHWLALIFIRRIRVGGHRSKSVYALFGIGNLIRPSPRFLFLPDPTDDLSRNVDIANLLPPDLLDVYIRRHGGFVDVQPLPSFTASR